jgi:hypothetical protein
MSSLDGLLEGLGTHSKILFIEKSLSSSINNLIQFSQLKTNTNISKVYWFSNTITAPLPTESLINNHITFLIRSDLANVPVLKARILEILQSAQQTQVSASLIHIDLLVTDDYYETFKYELDNVGLIGDIKSIKPWKLFLFENNVLNLNLDEFKSLYLHKNPNLPYKLASALNKYLVNNPQLKITHMLSKGLNSSKFVSIFKYLQNNNNNDNDGDLLKKKQELKIANGLYGSKSNNSGKQCDLIVFERNLDFLSCFLNQLTFSGLVDDVYKIDLNSIQLDSNDVIFLNEDKENEGLLYSKIQYLNFGVACDYLNLQAKELQQKYDEFQTIAKNTDSGIKKVKDFVEELQTLEKLKASVTNLTKVSEEILIKINAQDDSNSKFNELLQFQQDILLQNHSYSNVIKKLRDFIYSQNYQANDILRLVIVTSVVFNGLKEKDYNFLTTEIVEFYGIKYLLLFQNFIKIGLISIKGDLSIIKNFNHLNLKFQLIPEDEAEEQQDPSSVANFLEPNSPDFAYRGYVPLITRILQKTIKPNERSSWNNLELNSLILGKTIDEELLPTKNLNHTYSETYTNNEKLGGSLQNDSTVFIVMIGGVTYSELATIKYVERDLKKKHGVDKKFIVVTDRFINANSIIDSCL